MAEDDDTGGGPGFLERLTSYLCGFIFQIYLAFLIQVALIVILLFSLLYVEPGTSTHTILLFDVAILAVTFPATCVTLYLCRRGVDWKRYVGDDEL